MNWLMLLSVVISILVVSAVFLFIQSQVERMGSKNDEKNDERLEGSRSDTSAT